MARHEDALAPTLDHWLLRAVAGALWRGLPILVLSLWELGAELLRTHTVQARPWSWWAWVALGVILLGSVSRLRRPPEVENAPARARVGGLLSVLFGFLAGAALGLFRTAEWAWSGGQLAPVLIRAAWDAAVLTSILVVFATADLVETAGVRRHHPKEA